MNTITKLFAAAALLASTSTAVLAQGDAGAGAGASGDVNVNAGNSGVGVGVGGDAGANANSNAGGANASGNVNANAGASADGSINYGSIISELRTSSVTAADIEGLDATANIQIVTLSELRGNAAENASGLDEALSSLETSMEELRTAMEANTEISAALEAEGYTMDDVVAVTIGTDNSVTIVVDDAA